VRVTPQSLVIGERTIGPDQPCFIVAEVSANHNHSRDRAIEIIRAAANAGADAVKLQTYTADTLTINSDREWFQVPGSTLWGGRTLHQLYSEAHTPWDWHAELFRIAREEGLVCFSTPFDSTAVELLESLGSPVHKVASFELIDLALLDTVGRTGKPVIASVGMASPEEIDEALSTLRRAGCGAVALLKCTSAYPAPPESMNLRTIPHLRDNYGVVAGLSDHTMGSAVAVTAVALGASIVEKHFTLRRSDGGPDSAFSMEPDEFAQMVTEIRQAERALGTISYERSAAEESSLCFRRSLFVVADVSKGDTFSADNVRSIRPGYGLPPKYLTDVIGHVAEQDIVRGTPLSWTMIGQRR